MFLVVLFAAASLLTSNYFLHDIDDPKRNAQDNIEASYRDSSYVWEAKYSSPSKSDSSRTGELGRDR